jgi:DNA mismatch endonuclease (patch repair protein)
MTDHLTPEKRSWNMSLIRSRDTEPEKAVRSVLHRLGYRFRLHSKNLPGNPDIVLPKYKTSIFVHGCFWHQHENCRRANIPKSNTSYWAPKLKRNKEKDVKHQEALSSMGWKVVTVWECMIKDLEYLEDYLKVNIIK